MVKNTKLEWLSTPPRRVRIGEYSTECGEAHALPSWAAVCPKWSLWRWGEEPCIRSESP